MGGVLQHQGGRAFGQHEAVAIERIEQVRSTLRATALDLGPPRHDWETGYGLLNLN